MRIESEIKLGFKDVLIRPKRSTLNTRKDVDLQREFHFLHTDCYWKGIPIMAANMDTVGTFAMAESLSYFNMPVVLHKYYTAEEILQYFNRTHDWNYSMVSSGINNDDFERLENILYIKNIKYLCLDVANGYSEKFIDFVKRIRNIYSDKVIIAGNVVTGEMVEALLLAGAAIVKVGIGPGSVCTTRVKTGVGYPQLSAIIECADAAHGLKGHIIADGGCACAGDVAKSFGAGADFVMLGGMLSGHDESGQEISYDKNGDNPMMPFYGMSSREAMEKYSDGVAEYRAEEGKTVSIPYKGSVEKTIKDILGGLRSACTYVGAEKLKELSKRTTFIRVQEQENQVFN